MSDDFMDFMLSGGFDVFPELIGAVYECPYCSHNLYWNEKVEVISKNSFRCPYCNQEVIVEER